MSQLILASASPRRKELLEQVGYEFRIEPTDADETLPVNMTLEDGVIELAARKAKTLTPQPGEVILAADTLVTQGGLALGKPKNNDEAFEMLRRLSGTTHEVITGVALFHADGMERFYEKTIVSFNELDETLIARYIASKEPVDKAGAYGIQGLGAVLVKQITGDYNNVVGLPISLVYHKLKSYGIDPLIKED
ncbi:septum formation protein [Salsuginibacillus halophilus]|uniref:dTTP/UTP pyrophosphatase n=1 Tax=Salsuginibacillus halophilus TaxID=517424 RepID=A0A2P8HCT8_9BACI|nr:Maf family protein [Salsuginibacillus halophilus]PSL43972.1 septum formation protein [Salsuginibacillus halophilus]